MRALVLLSLLLGVIPVRAQDALPVVHARSRVVTVTDGLHVKKDYWYVMPEKKPDVYYVELPLQPHTVTFATDLGSISFDVTHGSRHRFIVRLADGTEALTEIRSDFRELLPYEPAAAGDRPALPFTVGDNDKLYLEGRIDGGRELSFQFDLGAGGSIIKKGSVAKVRMAFDGTLTFRNSDGENVVPSSSSNVVEIGTLRWRGVPFAVADNMTHREDALVGNSLFRGKILEIDHDRGAILIHDTLPVIARDWHREEMFLDGGTVPFVRGSLAVGAATRRGWFMLDTGAYTSILNDPALSPPGKFLDEARRLAWPFSRQPMGPQLGVGGQMLSGTNYSVRAYDGQDWFLGLLGNDVLKRFNLIVDNQQGAAYFRPNRNLAQAYRNPERIVVRAAALGLVVLVAAQVWRVRRRRRS